jgi:hypothetical protein
METVQQVAERISARAILVGHESKSSVDPECRRGRRDAETKQVSGPEVRAFSATHRVSSHEFDNHSAGQVNTPNSDRSGAF